MQQPSRPPSMTLEPCVAGSAPRHIMQLGNQWLVAAKGKTQLTLLTSGRTGTPAEVSPGPPLSLLPKTPSFQGKEAESGHPVGKKNRIVESKTLASPQRHCGGLCDRGRGVCERGACESSP